LEEEPVTEPSTGDATTEEIFKLIGLGNSEELKSIIKVATSTSKHSQAKE
jgi:hypothetical protein